MSTDAVHTGVKRASTGSERTPTETDLSRQSDPQRTTTTTDSTPTSFTGMRQKAYHFGDDFVPRQSNTCEDQPTGHADMERTARNLATHVPPSRRHAVLSHQPPAVTPFVQSANALATPCFAPPQVSPPVVHAVVIGVQDDSGLGSSPSLAVGPRLRGCPP